VAALAVRRLRLARHPSPKKSPTPKWQPPLPYVLGDDGKLEITFLDMQHGIGWVALREDLVVLRIGRECASFASGGEKTIGIEGLLFCFEVSLLVRNQTQAMTGVRFLS
jgi:hypothetical protein